MPIQHDEITLTDWDDAKDLLSADKTGWAWRGHLDARWSLSSSLERAISSPEIQRRRVEYAMFSLFTRRAHHYLDEDLPPLDDYLQWFSIMQHYGAPTRLLDWTYSPYIAAFFALENATDRAGSCVVWAIDFLWCQQQATERIRESFPEYRNFTVPTDNIWSASDFERLFVERSIDFIAPVEPHRLNQRLTIQQGLFLCQGNLEKSFEENLAVYDRQEKHVLKFILPNQIRAQALSDLNSMGLSRANLFPGIDGFAQSLRQVIVQMEDPGLAERRKLLSDKTKALQSRQRESAKAQD